MTNHEIAALVQSAAAALRGGDRHTARRLLTQAIHHDPQNEHAWLWMSGVVESATEQRECLEKVVALNPTNAAAQQGLTLLQPSVSAAPPEPWSPPEPLAAAALVGMAGVCYHCEAQVYGNAAFCWRCHAPVHVCANCVFAAEAACKSAQQIINLTARNQCPWWRPE